MAYSRKLHFENNIKAIKLAFSLIKEERLANASEIEILKQYSGFGGLKFVLFDPVKDVHKFANYEKGFIEPLKDLHDFIQENTADQTEYRAYIRAMKESVLTSFYTPTEVVNVIAETFKENNVTINNLLEPSAGQGNFIEGFKDQANSIRAFEKDMLTGLVLKCIYPDYRVTIDGFETIKPREKETFDVAVSNVPFGDIAVFDDDFIRKGDKAQKYSTRYIHDYFFLKSLDMVRDGGVVAFITSSGLMDSKNNSLVRRYIIDNANLISAIRLPEDTMKESGTEVISDLIILQKNSNKQNLAFSDIEKKFLRTTNINDVEISAYYENVNRIVHTKGYKGKDLYGKPSFIYEHSGGTDQIAQDLKGMLKIDFSNNFDPKLYNEHTIKNEKDYVAEKPKEGEQLGLFSQENIEVTQIANTRKGRPKKQPPKEQLNMFDALFAEVTEQDLKESQDIVKPTPEKAPEKVQVQATSKPNLPKSKFLDHDSFNQINNSVIFEDNILLIHDQRPGLVTRDEQGMFSYQIDYVELDKEKVQSYIDLRDAYLRLDQFEKTAKRESLSYREEMNDLYDKFVSKYGYIHNNKDLHVDSLINHVLSLEIKENKEYIKADIFTKPIAFKNINNLSIEESLPYSLNQKGRVDLALMAQVSNTPQSEIAIKLKDRIIYNPLNGEYQIKEKFLSGNVVEKLHQVRIIQDSNPDMNLKEVIQELEKAIPKQITFDELDFNFGERWIDTRLFSKFASELLDAHIEITYIRESDDFAVRCSTNTNNSNITDVYGVDSVNRKYTGLHLIQFALTDKMPIMTKKSINDKGEEINIPDSEAIQLMRGKLQDIQNKFTEWLIDQPESTKTYLVNTYNEKFNCYVKAAYDGSHLKLDDLNLKNLGIESVYPSQKNAVWMLLQNDGGIIDHEVGGGKTLIMCMAAHEMKRLGLNNKPMIIAMNANVQEIAETYRRAYPNDKIIAPTERDFIPARRKELFNKIKNSDCVVILSHEQYKAIPQDLIIQRDIIEEELYAIERALDHVKSTGGKKSKQAEKGLIRRKLSKEAKLKTVLADLAEKKDDTLSFKDMGVDHILVDESHQFKNLEFSTRHDRVAGLGDPNGSQRAFNLLIGIRTIQERTGRDLGATFLSGTPISNSLTELYLIFKYLRPKALERQNINCFDAWASVFARKSVDFEFSVTNQLIQKERFRYFIKVPELAAFYAEITDYKTAEDIGVKRPKLEETLINIKPTALQEQALQDLIKFAQTGDGKYIGRGELSEKEQRSKMLIATNEAKKVALDMRLVNPYCGEDKGTKVDVCAKMMHEEYLKYNEQKGTQFMFCDLGVPNPGEFSVYSELKRKLIEEYNIPEHEIRFIHDGKTKEQKKQIIADFNEGKIRLLFGSTQKLGTGVNAQKRVTATYNLDVTWKPSEWEQRIGRSQRAGNWLAETFAGNKVKNYIIAVERSLDNFKFNLMHNKGLFIRQIKSANMSSRRLDEGAADESTGVNMSEYVAVLSGNTALLDKSRLETKIITLEGERMSFLREKSGAKFRYNSLSGDMENARELLGKFEVDSDHISNFPKNDKGEIIPKFFFDDKEIKNPKEIASILHNKGHELCVKHEKLVYGSGYELIGYYHDLEIVVKAESIDRDFEKNTIRCVPRYALKGKSGLMYRYNNGILATDEIKATLFFPNALDKLPGLIESKEIEISEGERNLAKLSEYVNKEWSKEDELNSLREELIEVDKRINLSLDQDKGISNNNDNSIEQGIY